MNKKNIIVSLFASLFCLFSFGKSSDEVNVTRELKPFKVLTIHDDLNVILIEGEAPSITIEGGQRTADAVVIEEKGDQLIIRKKDLRISQRKVFVYLTVTNLRSIEVINSARVFSSGSLEGDLLWVKLAGNGEVNVDSDATKVLTTSWSNGKIFVRGHYCSTSTFRSDSGKLVTSYNKNCGNDSAEKN
jgi:formylmethanofuran dehydrogenase subunit C